MKHILYNTMTLALALTITLTMTSCSDWLTIEPRDMVTEDNFWNEKTDIEQSVAGVYAAMQSEDFISRCVVWGESRSENLYPSGTLTSGDYYEIMRENLLSTNGFTKWDKFYYVINQCNVIYEMAPKVSEKDPSYRSSDVLATQAEMVAIRSLCYFYLIRTFDEVPFSREGKQQEDEVEYKPASKFEYVLGEIIKDLESVKGNALVHYANGSNDGIGMKYNTNCNRITRTSINAMLADMYLWQGNYDKCIECAEAVLKQKRADYDEEYSTQTTMQSSGPQLVQGVFGRIVPLYVATTGNPSNVDENIFGTGNSFESLFELSFNYTSGSSYVKSSALGTIYGTGNTDIDNNGSGKLVINPTIVGDLNTSSSQYFDNQYDMRFYNCFKAVDANYGEGYIRKYVAERYNLQSNSGNTKIVYDNSSGNAFTLESQLDRNWIFYRMSDVMLLEAEAYAMKADDAQKAGAAEDVYKDWLKSAFDLVYVVNKRHITYATYYLRTTHSAVTSPGQAIQLIRAEREREFIFEGKRWFDLLRQCRRDGNPSLVRTLVSSKLSGSASGKSFPSLDALYWPYNKEELKVNTNLKQKSIYASEKSDEYEMN